MILLLMFIFMRVLAGYGDILTDSPLSSAPDDTIPSHIGIVLNVLIVQLDTPHTDQLDILIKLQLIIISNMLHYLIDVRVLLRLRERVPYYRVPDR